MPPPHTSTKKCLAPPLSTSIDTMTSNLNINIILGMSCNLQVTCLIICHIMRHVALVGDALNVKSCHVTLYHVMLHYIITCNVISRHVTLYLAVLRYIASCYIIKILME